MKTNCIISTNLQDQVLSTEFINQVLEPLATEITNFINQPDSPLGDLDANLHSIQWLANDNHVTCILTIALQTEDHYLIGPAANEAYTAQYALPYILTKVLDNSLCYETSHLCYTNSAIILTADFIY